MGLLRKYRGERTSSLLITYSIVRPRRLLRLLGAPCCPVFRSSSVKPAGIPLPLHEVGLLNLNPSGLRDIITLYRPTS